MSKDRAVWLIREVSRISHQSYGDPVAVVDYLPGSDGDEVVLRWCHHMGFSEQAHTRYRAEYAPITTWASILASSLPCQTGE